jgi:hypothetical protein
MYTDKQLFHALNIFTALISIIRTSDGALRLNRLGSNSLEHAFGSARVRCHDVNTMKKMIDAFTNIELTRIAHSMFSLFSSAHGRLSVGVNCGEFISSPLSIFSSSPKAIAITLLIHGGIDLSRIYTGPIPHCDAWTELLGIPDFQPTAKQNAADSTGKDANCPQSRKISSNQIFLRIPRCPRTFHLISSPNHMANILAGENAGVEAALQSIHGRKLPMRTLRMHVRRLAREIGVGPLPEMSAVSGFAGFATIGRGRSARCAPLQQPHLRRRHKHYKLNLRQS